MTKMPAQADESLNAKIGQQVQQWMAAAGMRQGTLAKELGLTQAAVSRKLSGERPWFPDELAAVAALFGGTVGELFGEIPGAVPVLAGAA